MNLRVIMHIFTVFLLLTVSSALHLDDVEPVFFDDAHTFRSDKVTDLRNGFAGAVELNELDKSIPTVKDGDEAVDLNSVDSESLSARRKRRQVASQNRPDISVSQGCEGIILQWIPSIPFNEAFHNSNSEFSHYNIYRETNVFSTVAGLTPIVSGKDYPELKNLQRQKWIDKFPPTGRPLFYAVTIVNQKGEETQNVVSKKISFIGTFDDVGGAPVRIIANLLKGNVLHHSVAFNYFRNEYFVVFDMDQNNDNKPDLVYGFRTNGLGQILDRKVLNFTLGGATTEQGHPTVAFNPVVQEYLVAFHLSAPSLRSGAYVIIGQRLYGSLSKSVGNSYVLLNVHHSKKDASATEPKLIYNAGSAGYGMIVMVQQPPNLLRTVFVTFINHEGNKVISSARPFGGKVVEANLFMDTRYRHVYIVYQIPRRGLKLTKESDVKLKNIPYVIVVTKTNGTGSLLPLRDLNSAIYVVGYTRERNANIDGYFDKEMGWLRLFWNNRENGRKVISSSSVFGVPGMFIRLMNTHNCSSHVNVQNAATCYLPTNNGYIMIWEEGKKLNGYLIKDGAFNPMNGIQRRPKVVYNSRDSKAFVVYQQTVSGRRELFVRNIAPGANSSCRLGCKFSERCVMKNVCAARNPVAARNLPTCSKNKGGCSHTCTSLVKGRTCSCPSSHTLAFDGMNCFLKATTPDVSLLYSSVGSIWSVSIYSAEKRIAFTRIPFQGQNIISFFYNAKDKHIYWADSVEGKIYKSLLDGANKKVLVNNNVIVPDGMVVDAEARQLYWTDGQLGKVFRSMLNGASVASFVTGIDNPRALAFHQKKKWLFWTNWGAVARIERINSDGSNRVLLVNTGLKWPNGLTHDGKYLYWADAYLDKIEMSDLNGNGRIILTTKGVHHPYGLGISGHRLYWTDWTGHIRSLDKRQSSLQPDVIVLGLKKPFSLQIYNETAGSV